MVYLFKRSNLKKGVEKDDVEDFLFKLIAYNGISMHAVYTNPVNDLNRAKDHLDIRQHRDTGKLRFSVLPYIPPEYSHFTELFLDKWDRSFVEPPEAAPRIIREADPRRIAIDDSSIRKVDRFIDDPYEFLGFEVRFPLFGINIFASSLQRCAGLKRYRLIEKQNRPHVETITQSLNNLIYPKIDARKVVG